MMTDGNHGPTGVCDRELSKDMASLLRFIGRRRNRHLLEADTGFACVSALAEHLKASVEDVRLVACVSAKRGNPRFELSPNQTRVRATERRLAHRRHHATVGMQPPVAEGLPNPPETIPATTEQRPRQILPPPLGNPPQIEQRPEQIPPPPLGRPPQVEPCCNSTPPYGGFPMDPSPTVCSPLPGFSARATAAETSAVDIHEF